MGTLYHDGYGVRQELDTAHNYFIKACNLNDAQGCFNLGIEYGNGKGIEQDYRKAKYYYEKACNLDNQKGCHNYKLLNKQGY